MTTALFRVERVDQEDGDMDYKIVHRNGETLCWVLEADSDFITARERAENLAELCNACAKEAGLT